MSKEIEEEQGEELKNVLDNTLHRLKNNLQTQLSLMNIQNTQSKSYFDEKKVIKDRFFALTYVYDLYYTSIKNDSRIEDTKLSFHAFFLKFYQYFETSGSLIKMQLKNTTDLKVGVDDLLLLSYIIIEINDFSKTLEKQIDLEINQKYKAVFFKFSFINLDNHENFKLQFKDHLEVFNLIVLQLKGKIELEKKHVRLSFPIQ